MNPPFLTSFTSVAPYFGFISLLTWLITDNTFFAYVSLGTAIVVSVVSGIYMSVLAWRYGSVVEIDAEIDFKYCLTYLGFILMILVSFLYKVVMA